MKLFDDLRELGILREIVSSDKRMQARADAEVSSDRKTRIIATLIFVIILMVVYFFTSPSK